MKETRLEILDGKNAQELNAKKRVLDREMLINGWRHKEVSLTTNNTGFCIVAMIYERDHQPPPPMVGD